MERSTNIEKYKQQGCIPNRCTMPEKSFIFGQIRTHTLHQNPFCSMMLCILSLPEERRFGFLWPLRLQVWWAHASEMI